MPSSNQGRAAIVRLGGTFLLTLGLFVVGWLLYVPTQNLPLVLSTLAGAQAALFGIVFAITTLGIQLTSNRYSPRLVFLFIDGWTFRAAFSVFVTSIGFDLVLLSQVSSAPSRVLSAAVAAAGGLALASIVILYWFVRSTLAQSTPEGLIEAIADDLPPSTYLETTIDAEQNDDPHPLHRLYSLTMAALSQGESETAFRGVETIDEIATTGLEHIQEHEDDIDDTETETAFKRVQEEYLPEIALHAYENDERRTASRTIEALETLGKTGLEGDTEAVTRYSSSGLAEIIDATPLVVDGNTLRNTSAETLSDLLTDSVSYSWSTYRTLLHDLNYRLVVLLRRDADPWVYQELIGDHMRQTLPAVQERLLEEYSDEIDANQINWHRPHEGDASSPSESVERFIRYHRTIGKITEAILRYTYRNDDYPLADGSFRTAWERIAINAAQSPLSSYAILITQTLITTAYYVDRIEGGEVGSWELAVANVMDDGDPKVVEQAFEELARGNYSDHKLISIYLQHENESEKGRRMFTRLFETPTATDLYFEEWLNQFRKKVQDRHRA